MGTAAAQPSLRTVLYYTNYCSGFSSKLFPFVYQTQKKGRVLYASAPQQRVLLHLRREEKGMLLLFRSLFLLKAALRSVEYFFKLYLIYFY